MPKMIIRAPNWNYQLGFRLYCKGIRLQNLEVSFVFQLFKEHWCFKPPSQSTNLVELICHIFLLNISDLQVDSKSSNDTLSTEERFEHSQEVLACDFIHPSTSSTILAASWITSSMGWCKTEILGSPFGMYKNLKPYRSWGTKYLPYQLAQVFFYQQYITVSSKSF